MPRRNRPVRRLRPMRGAPLTAAGGPSGALQRAVDASPRTVALYLAADLAAVVPPKLAPRRPVSVLVFRTQSMGWGAPPLRG
jgi:hypothetical protein